jgi:hypothetical protein
MIQTCTHTQKVLFYPKLYNGLLQIFGLLQSSPLKKNLILEIHKLRTKEIGKFSLEIVFSYPSGFIFSVVAPLNLQKLDTLSSGGSVSFL